MFFGMLVRLFVPHDHSCCESFVNERCHILCKRLLASREAVAVGAEWFVSEVGLSSKVEALRQCDHDEEMLEPKTIR